MIVEVQNRLRIETSPVSLSLVEGDGIEREISVSLSRIPEGSSSVMVTIKLPEGSGLKVSPSSLTFSATKLQTTVTVTAINNSIYTGDREVTLTFEADDYTTARVTVNITEDDLQTIELMVVGTTALNLVRFSTTDITVRVNVATGLTVRAEGAVSLASGVAEYDLTEDALSQQIQIEAVSVGEGTITFTASGARQSTAMEMVRVMVSTPTLVISDVSALAINLVARTTTGLTVRVSAEAGVPEGVTLTATVSGEAGRVVSVNPMERVIETVSVDTPAMFTVEGLDAGTATLTLMASHSDYESASIDVSVSVYLPGVELSATPTSLQFEQGATESFTVAVSASTQAMITIRSGNDDIARVSSQAFTLLGGESNPNAEIVVSGGGIGRTTLTITASADGYATEEVVVIVEVQNRLRIETSPVSLSLVEGDGIEREISVSLSRIPEGSSSVMVTIKLPEGSGLKVSPSSLTFSATKLQTTVTVTAINNSIYTGDREVTLTFEADDYTTARVTVNITEDDLQTIELMVVGTTALNLVRFSTTDITVRVNVATGLTVRAEGAVSLASGVAEYDLTEDALSQQIQIEAVSVGEGTITFTASGARQSTAMEMVRVMVSTPTLVISDVSALAINLVARTTTGLTVRVSAEAGVPEGVTLTATVSGEAGRVVSVNPMERVIETVSVDTPAMFTVEGLDAGTATLTLMASHSDYESASIDVSVSVYLPGVELSATPTSLQFEQGATESFTVAVSASTQAMITIRSGNDGIARVSSQPFTLMGGEINNSTMIEVSGVGIGRTTLTITASADGYAIGTATVMVDVLNRFRIGAMPARFNLAEGSSRTISVSLTLIEANTTVTVNIAATTGLSVMPSSLTFSSSSPEPQNVRVTVDDDDKYEGDRSTTLTLTADGYTPVRVTVNITEDDLQTIELMVVGTTALNLVRFSTTDITVRVNVATGLTVRAEGAVSLASGVAEYDLTEDALSQQIQIEAVSVGEGTITFTASGARQSTAMEMVRVMVSTPTLVISDVSALAINLVARTTTGLTVRVSAEAGVPEGVTLTATVSGEAGRVVSVNPMERVIETVSVDTPAMFTVEGLDAGDTTITLIASHPDYESTSIDVSVSVYLPGVGLIVSTPSPFEQGATGLLTVAVSASTQAMITIRSGNDDIARVSSQPFTLMGGEINNSTMIEVSGDWYRQDDPDDYSVSGRLCNRDSNSDGGCTE